MPDITITPSVQQVTITPTVQSVNIGSAPISVYHQLDASSFWMFTDGHERGSFNLLLGTPSGTGSITFANDYSLVTGQAPVVGVASIISTENEQFSRAALCDRESTNSSVSPSIKWDQGASVWKARIKRTTATNTAHRFEAGFFYNHNYNPATSANPDSYPTIDTNFCWYNRGTDNWKILVSSGSGGTPSYTTTSVTASDWHTLEIRVASDYDSVIFLADGTVVATITRAQLGANFPEAGVAMYGGVSVRNCPELDGGGVPLPVASGVVGIDFMSVEYQINRS